MTDLLDDRLRTELHRLVEGKSASRLMRQRVEHGLDRAPRTRATMVIASAAAVILLIVAAVALAGGSSSKPTHVASRGVTTAPAGSALAPQDVPPPPNTPPQAGYTATSAPSGTPTTSVASRAASQSPQPRPTSTTASGGSHGFVPPSTTAVTTPQPSRATPSVSDNTGPYAVEVIGRIDGGIPKGWFRRSDARGSTTAGPDSYGAMTESDWGGTPGPRYLSIGAVGNASQGAEPGRIYEYGAVGTDAVRVDVVLPDGRRLPTTLGTATVGGLKFWVVGFWPMASDYGKAVATDGQGNTWEVDGGGAGYGYTP